MTDITREELKARMDRGYDFGLVDALSAEQYESSHLPGAVNLPYEFVDQAERVLPDKNAEIIVYCMNTECEASAEEARELTQMGYRNVRHYAEASRVGSRPASPSRASAPPTSGGHRKRIIVEPRHTTRMG